MVFVTTHNGGRRSVTRDYLVSREPGGRLERIGSIPRGNTVFTPEGEPLRIIDAGMMTLDGPRHGSVPHATRLGGAA